MLLETKDSSLEQQGKLPIGNGELREYKSEECLERPWNAECFVNPSYQNVKISENTLIGLVIALGFLNTITTL